MSKIQTNQIQHTANGASVFTLPQTDGSANQLMKTDGSGNLGWATDQGGSILQTSLRLDGTRANYAEEVDGNNFTDARNLSGLSINYDPD